MQINSIYKYYESDYLSVCRQTRMNIVSGFISNINRRSDRDLTKYLKFGFELMAVEIPMTIFIEKLVFDANILPHLLSKCMTPSIPESKFVYKVCGGVMDGMQQKYSYVQFGHITFVFFEMEDLFLWSSRRMAHGFKLNTGNPNKDTLEYMMVQCQKTEWMAIAAQLFDCIRGYNTNRQSFDNTRILKDGSFDNTRILKDGSFDNTRILEHIWIDFGSFHMFQNKIDVFQSELYKLRSRINRRLSSSSQSDSKITIARCWDPNHIYYGDIYKDINWLFAGSIFGGNVEAINIFACKMREKCFQVLREHNTLMWEINIWVLIYREAKDLFVLYPSDHSEILFRGFV
jgi:hypothetical protein